MEIWILASGIAVGGELLGIYFLIGDLRMIRKSGRDAYISWAACRGLFESDEEALFAAARFRTASAWIVFLVEAAVAAFLPVVVVIVGRGSWPVVLAAVLSTALLLVLQAMLFTRDRLVSG